MCSSERVKDVWICAHGLLLFVLLVRSLRQAGSLFLHVGEYFRSEFPECSAIM
jgi:hypothetical protein